MERLPLEQHAAMISIYKAPRNLWLVRTPSCKESTITMLYKLGYISTDRIFNHKILRFKITEEGLKYGQRYVGSTQITIKK